MTGMIRGMSFALLGYARMFENIFAFFTEPSAESVPGVASLGGGMLSVTLAETGRRLVSASKEGRRSRLGLFAWPHHALPPKEKSREYNDSVHDTR